MMWEERVGFPCIATTGEKEIVTAGHNVMNNAGSLGYTVKVNLKTFGTVRRLQYGNTVDAAFVERSTSVLPPWWIFQNKLTNGETIHQWGNSSVTPEGSTVRKYGDETGLTTGKVTSNSASFEINNMIFYALTQTTLEAQSGDSGGPCLTTVNGKNTLVGIMKGKDAGYSYYCKINYIMKELNVTPLVPAVA